MHAHGERRTSHVILAATAALSMLVANSQCSAQGEANAYNLLVEIQNSSGHLLAPGDLQLWLVGETVPEVSLPIRQMSLDSLRQANFSAAVLEEGRRYRVTFRAICADDPTKEIECRSFPFVFRPYDNFKLLVIEPRHVITRPIVRGNLVRLKLNKATNAPRDIFVNPGDWLEIDYVFQGSHPTVTPKGGSHPDVVSLIGAKFIKVDDQVVGVASYFEARRLDDDWITIEIDGIPHRFHIWVVE